MRVIAVVAARTLFIGCDREDADCTGQDAQAVPPAPVKR